MPTTTTLNQIKSFSPCTSGWKKVLGANKHLGMVTPFPVSSILESNDMDDTLWVVSRINKLLTMKFSLFCARQVEHLMTDQRSIDALNVLERYINGEASVEELAQAKKEAYDAASAAYASASAAYSAYSACAAACAARTVASYHASRAADIEIKNDQIKKLIELLDE